VCYLAIAAQVQAVINAIGQRAQSVFGQALVALDEAGNSCFIHYLLAAAVAQA
jgi:hypothetical protein